MSKKHVLLLGLCMVFVLTVTSGVMAQTAPTHLKIGYSTGEETVFEYLEIWEPFENYSVGELIELIEAGYKGNLNFAEAIRKCV